MCRLVPPCSAVATTTTTKQADRDDINLLSVPPSAYTSNHSSYNSSATAISSSTTTSISAYPDSACSGHYMALSDAQALHNVQRTSVHNSITVHVPNGSSMSSTHTAELCIPGIPLAARQCHLFAEMTTGASLVSIPLLCDHGCTATFRHDDVSITTPDGATILTGKRMARAPTSSASPLWRLALPTIEPAQAHATVEYCAFNTIQHSTNAQLVQFYSECLGCPVNSTLSSTAISVLFQD